MKRRALIPAGLLAAVALAAVAMLAAQPQDGETEIENRVATAADFFLTSDEPQRPRRCCPCEREAAYAAHLTAVAESHHTNDRAARLEAPGNRQSRLTFAETNALFLLIGCLREAQEAAP